MIKGGRPEKGELVICQITRIHPNSAEAELIEYGLHGMIHVSEVARRWVRSIKEFLREGEWVVCRVIGLEDSTILLSIKRVSKDEKAKKLNEFKRERRAEKLLEIAARELKVKPEKIWGEIGEGLIENFGSLRKAFEIALKNPELLKSRVNPKWAEKLIEVARRSYGEKEYEVKVRISLRSFEPDGVERIKQALSAVKLDVRYLSAPYYLLEARGKDYRQVRKEVEAAARQIAEKFPGASWEIIE